MDDKTPIPDEEAIYDDFKEDEEDEDQIVVKICNHCGQPVHLCICDRFDDWETL